MGFLDIFAPLDDEGRPSGNIGMIARLIGDKDFRQAENEAARDVTLDKPDESFWRW